jgi:hypothetical protein
MIFLSQSLGSGSHWLLAASLWMMMCLLVFTTESRRNSTISPIRTRTKAWSAQWPLQKSKTALPGTSLWNHFIVQFMVSVIPSTDRAMESMQMLAIQMSAHLRKSQMQTSGVCICCLIKPLSLGRVAQYCSLKLMKKQVCGSSTANLIIWEAKSISSEVTSVSRL